MADAFRCIKLTFMIILLSIHVTGQEIHQYADTFKLQNSNPLLSEDQLLLSLIHNQTEQLQAKEDSIHLWRLHNDTTTAFPFYIGYADSLRIDSISKKHYLENPLLLPLIYVPQEDSSLYKQNTDYQYQLRQSARMYMITHHPDLLAGVLNKKAVSEVLIEDYEGHDSRDVQVKIVRSLMPDPEGDRRALKNALRENRTHWYREGTLMLQLTQNYVSKNWYAGGNSNFSLLGIAQGQIKYDSGKRITWENSGEWRAGFNTVSQDTLRKINTNEDIFKIYSKLGFKIYKQILSYSFSADLQTHFFNTWKDNTKELKTGPLTPVRFNLATGIDYKPTEGLSIYFAPLSYKMVYAADTTHAEQTTFSIEQGKKILNEVGSSIRVEWQWQPVREIKLSSIFYLYTNYKRVEIDWDTSCDFIITRYLSARIMIHPRYDTTVILPDDEKAKIQFKELISIGFAHNFK